MTDGQDRTIEELLRREFEKPLSDDGFSSRVLAALPPRERPRRWIVPAAMLVGSVSAWAVVGPAPVWQLAIDEWLAGRPAAGIIVTLALGLATGLMACTWAVAETD